MDFSWNYVFFVLRTEDKQPSAELLKFSSRQVQKAWKRIVGDVIQKYLESTTLLLPTELPLLSNSGRITGPEY